MSNIRILKRLLLEVSLYQKNLETSVNHVKKYTKSYIVYI